MKTNQDLGDSEPSSVLYPASDRVGWADHGPELDRGGDNRVGISPGGAVAGGRRQPWTIPAPHTSGLFHNLAHRHAGHDF